MSKLIDGINDLKTVFPNVAIEWHPTKNGELLPSNVTYGSGKKVWWKCTQGHSWQASVCNRIKGAGCPYCSGRYPVVGENDLLTLDSSLANEWNYERNKDTTPSSVSSKSSKKIWWKCVSGHEWQATVADRARGNGCPYCSGRRILSGFNDLATVNPLLASEWDWSKNKNITPSLISPNSHKKVWWVCSTCGNEWFAQIKSRNTGCGCPECAKTIQGHTSHINHISKYGSLSDNNPQLAKEWDTNKNKDLSPHDVSSNSGSIVWWKCSKGHEWQASVYTRTNGAGCPYCSNHRVLKGFNDLATINPILASEWDYEKNVGLTDGNGVDVSSPERITAVSGQRVWWKCVKGHSWQATVANRTNGRGCPMCSSAGTSIPEQGVAFYLEQLCKVEQRIKIAGKEIDIYLPEYSIGIETNIENIAKICY